MAAETGTSTRVQAWASNGLVTLYVLDCANCGVLFGINVDYEERRRADGRSFSCPNGHTNSWSDTEAKRALRAAEQLRVQNERLNRRLANAQEDARAANASLIATKVHLTRMRKRIANGVCPCCTRSFTNVRRHMATQHPEVLAKLDQATSS